MNVARELLRVHSKLINDSVLAVISNRQRRFVIIFRYIKRILRAISRSLYPIESFFLTVERFSARGEIDAAREMSPRKYIQIGDRFRHENRERRRYSLWLAIGNGRKSYIYMSSELSVWNRNTSDDNDIFYFKEKIHVERFHLLPETLSTGKKIIIHPSCPNRIRRVG